MILKVTSFRGHHEATVEDNAVAEAIFNKMTGKTQEPLAAEIIEVVPDTFQELEALWNPGKMGYTAFTGVGDEGQFLKEFDPEVEDIVFIAPITGG